MRSMRVPSFESEERCTCCSGESSKREFKITAVRAANRYSSRYRARAHGGLGACLLERVQSDHVAFGVVDKGDETIRADGELFLEDSSAVLGRL
jgi:phage gp36-like protein